MSIIRDDLIERSVKIRWPDGFDPDNADPFAHNTVLNDPSGKLAEGVTFDWTTFGLKIASTIAECVPHTRIGCR